MKRFSVWLEEKTIKRLADIGKTEDRPIGWLIRKAIEEFVKNYRQEKK